MGESKKAVNNPRLSHMKRCEQLTAIVKHFSKVDKAFDLNGVNGLLDVELPADSFKLLTQILLNRKHIEQVSESREGGPIYKVTRIGAEFITKSDYCLDSRLRYRFQNLYERQKKRKRKESSTTITLAIATVLFGVTSFYFGYQNIITQENIQEKELQIKRLQHQLDSLGLTTFKKGG